MIYLCQSNQDCEDRPSGARRTKSIRPKCGRTNQAGVAIETGPVSYCQGDPRGYPENYDRITSDNSQILIIALLNY